jgi:lipoprotein-anchoring transpeptidase ErfK/SrfK
MTTPVYPRPTSRSESLGYARAGTDLDAVRGPIAGHGCGGDDARDGWYELHGGGFVCVGRSAALTEDVSRAQRRRFGVSAQDAPMPFPYAVVYQSTVLYRRLPSLADEQSYERNLGTPVAIPPPGAPTLPTLPPIAPLPETLETLAGEPGSPVIRRVTRGMYLSLDRQVRGESRTSYWRTQGGGFVRAGAVSTVGPRTWSGVALDEAHTLPLGFAASSESQRYRRTETGFAVDGRLPRLATFALSADAPVPWRGDVFHLTRDGFYVRARHTTVVTAQPPPANLQPGERWIDVNLDRQSLVAYEGDRPVFATAVSTGLRGRGPTNYETVQGEFRIEVKHRTATMDGNTPNGGVYSIEDVPWVMYFHDSFALHGAFWHQGFGRTHSHGCVNLSPPDARWLFGWTSPALPEGWHGVVATPERPGTRVFVHYDRQGLGEAGAPAHVPSH